METSASNRIRYVLFAGAILVHVVAFWLLANLIIFQAPPVAPEDNSQFQIVPIAVPKPPVVVPPPTVPSPTVTMPAFQPDGGNGAGKAVDVQASMTPRAITMPNVTPSLNDATAQAALAALNRLPAVKTDTDQIIHGAGDAANTGDTAGDGTGKGAGDGSDNGTGRGPFGSLGVGGNHIPKNEKVGMIFDDSTSVTDTGVSIQILQTKMASYPNAIYVGSPNAGGQYIPNPKNDTDAAATSPIRITLESPMNSIPMDAESKDLYAGIYISLHRGMTSVLLVSDFEGTIHDDQRTDAATTAVINAMRAAHVKLYLLTIKLSPPKALIDYAEESGGSSSNYRR